MELDPHLYRELTRNGGLRASTYALEAGAGFLDDFSTRGAPEEQPKLQHHVNQHEVARAGFSRAAVHDEAEAGL